MEIKMGNIYHCETEEDAKDLLVQLEEFGYKWHFDIPLVAKKIWKEYKEKTCFRIYNKNVVLYGLFDYFSELLRDGLIDGEIIEYNKGDKL